MKELKWFFTTTLAVAYVSACGDTPPPDRGFTVRDSAGITIVESLEPAWQESESWALSPEPILDIGVVEGDPVYQLDQVRDVARTSSGDVVVANRGSQEIRFYDSTGQFLRRFGGEGDGPGEFRQLEGFQLRSSDTVVAFDYSGRVTAFGPAAEVVWTAMLGAGEPLRSPSSFGDGAFLQAFAIDAFQILVVEARSGPSRILTVPAALVRYSSAAVPMDTIGVFPGFDVASVEMPGGAQGTGSALFGRSLTYAAHQEHTYVGTGDGYEIRVLGLDGSLVRIVRRLNLDLRVTQAAVDSLVSDLLRTIEDPDRRSRQEQIYAVTPLPEARAPYSDILVDSDGYLWVSGYHLGSARKPTRFTVFDPDSRWLGEMTVPENFQVFEIGEDYVLGVATDELDVEHVRMYGLVR